jgi:hypothetical protein
MDSIKFLLDKYGISDPVTDDTVGVFQDSEMQGLYDKLVADGSASLEAAMLAGATIEDLDIHDLNNLISATDNDDILTVYQNMAKGSRNHLRSFVSQLSLLGTPYTAQYLTQAEVDQIVASPMERGRYDKTGKAMFNTPRGKYGRGGGCMGGRCGNMNFVDENGNGICDLME